MLANNPIIYLFRMMWRFSKGNRPKVVLYVLYLSLANISGLITPLIFAQAINIIQLEGINETTFPKLLMWMGLVVGQAVFFWAFMTPGRYTEQTNAFLVRKNYQEFLVKGVLALPSKWHTDHHSGDTIDKVNKGASAMYDFSGSTFIYIRVFIHFIGALIALAYFEFISIAIVLFLAAVSMFIVFRFDKILIAQYKELNKKDNIISERIYDAISNITTVIILRVEKLLHNDIMQAILNPFSLYRRNTKLNEIKWALVGIVGASMYFFVIASYIWGALGTGEVILVGTITAMYQYIGRIQNFFFDFAWMYSKIVRHRAAVSNAEELSQEFPENISFEHEVKHANWKVCEINDLVFSYHARDEDKKVEYDLHLDHVSMNIARGEKIAVIGESGSGKTTFLKILRGLYEPESVNVALDSKKISEGFEGLSADIALIPQDPEIFTTTIRNNITIGIEHSDENIQKYTDLARFSNVVTRLPNGLESSIVEKGVNLSGGEKQRLALARGLMASEDKSIILMDESTSSVDPENEAQIYEQVFDTYKDKTIIASIHRLHLLRMFETIYLFDRGKIIAQGTFDELLETSDKFKAMWKNYTDRNAIST